MGRFIEKSGHVVRTVSDCAPYVQRRRACCTPLVRMMDGTRGRRVLCMWRGGQAMEDKTTYGVFSYGTHWLHYVYDAPSRQWYANADRYPGPTTRRHMDLLRPTLFEYDEQGNYLGERQTMRSMSNEELQHLFDVGLERYITHRLMSDGQT